MAVFVFNIHLLQAQVGIGTISPTSTLSVEGSFGTNIDLLFSDTTLDETHHTVIGNGIIITLPSPDNIIGKVYDKMW